MASKPTKKTAKAAPSAKSSKSVKAPAAAKKKAAPKVPVAAKKAAAKAPAKAASVRKPAPVAKKPAPKAAAPVKASAKKSDAPIIRTGPSIAPRNLGSAGMAALRGAPVQARTSTGKIKPLSEKEIAHFKDLLLKLRDRIVDEIAFLANDNLNKSAKDASGDLSSYSFHMADQGTDNFDREFAASLLNSEHDVLYEIDEALRRIEQGGYGVCEMSGLPIERDRLKALPFARYSVSVQSEMERGKPRYRPFRRTSIQGTDAV